jgi:uncharacterized protein
VIERRGNWMQTFTGRQFYPEDPRPGDIDIEDIAHALSRVSRFGGHSEDMYSVAQHSVLVAQTVAAELASLYGLGLADAPDIILWGLLHDASEAYIGDVVWPLKRAPEMKGYKEIEVRVMDAVVRRFDLIPGEPQVVKACDIKLLATEKRDIMSYGTERARSAGREAKSAQDRLGGWYSDSTEPLPRIIRAWQPNVAKRTFLELFHQMDAVRAQQKAKELLGKFAAPNFPDEAE